MSQNEWVEFTRQDGPYSYRYRFKLEDGKPVFQGLSELSDNWSYLSAKQQVFIPELIAQIIREGKVRVILP